MSQGSAKPSVTLVVPGLLEPAAQARQAGLALTGIDRLRLLLARANRCAAAGGFFQTLFALFNVPVSAWGDWPVAALSALSDMPGHSAGAWLRADPVHLHPDRDRLLMFGPSTLELTAPEAAALVDALNAHFSQDGWTFHAPAPQRWYVQLQQPPQLRTTALPDVVGDDIRDHLPAGAAASDWRNALNEAQMLLHGHEVNRERETRGLPSVNSVWFWGGGALPRRAQCQWRSVRSADALVAGLGLHGGVDVEPLPASVERWLSGLGGGAHLVVCDTVQDAVLAGDLDAWVRAVQGTEAQWFGPLCAALKRGVLNALELYPDDGCVYRITRSGLRRFWRRNHSALD